MAKEKEKKVNKENKHFMKDFKAELKKVAWPTSKQMVNNVTAVITIVLITAAIVFLLDLVFISMNEYGINKLKSNIQSKQQSQSQVIENATDGQTDENSDNGDSAENSQEAENQNAENGNSDENNAQNDSAKN